VEEERTGEESNEVSSPGSGDEAAMPKSPTMTKEIKKVILAVDFDFVALVSCYFLFVSFFFLLYCLLLKRR